MSIYRLSRDDAIRTLGSSRGTQIKFRKDGFWYKIDEVGYEGKSEELVSKVLECSNLDISKFVHYEACQIGYGNKVYNGCRSKDFCDNNEIFLSYAKIYEIMTGRNLDEDIIPLNDPEERIDFVCNVVNDFAGINVKEHIGNNLTLDMFTLNTDRHLDNIGIITDKDYNNARNAPIFDNGAEFLSNMTKYPPDFDIKSIDVHSNIFGKPFSPDLEYQAICCKSGTIKFDYNKINTLTNSLANSRAGRILHNQLQIYKEVSSLFVRPEPISKQMEQTWHTYMNLSPEQKNGIPWNGEKLRPAVFDDMYLAQCQKEGKEPDKKIYDHFWGNCVGYQEYEPRFCTRNMNFSRER